MGERRGSFSVAVLPSHSAWVPNHMGALYNFFLITKWLSQYLVSEHLYVCPLNNYYVFENFRNLF